MISAVICMSLRLVWHLCNLTCVNALFRLISNARYFFKSPSICFFEGKTWRFSEFAVNILLTCIQYIVTPGPTVTKTVCKYRTCSLIVLAPQDSNVAIYPQVCCLVQKICHCTQLYLKLLLRIQHEVPFINTSEATNGKKRQKTANVWLSRTVEFVYFAKYYCPPWQARYPVDALKPQRFAKAKPVGRTATTSLPFSKY